MQSEEEKTQSDAMFAANEPFALLNQWLDEAWAQPNEPNANAMSLATVDELNMPNVRMVLAKGIDERGIVFFTNFESQKGAELLANAGAAICFYWRSLDRQVRARGSVVTVEEAEADAYFASRDRESQIGAWASRQSRPVESRATFEDEITRVQNEYHDKPVSRPDYWSGFRIIPSEIEFWHQRDFRLHDRLVFRRTDAKTPWSTVRLFP